MCAATTATEWHVIAVIDLAKVLLFEFEPQTCATSAGKYFRIFGRTLAFSFGKPGRHPNIFLRSSEDPTNVSYFPHIPSIYFP
jgi:hypothetical protein